MAKLLLRVKARIIKDRRIPLHDSIIIYKIVNLQTRETFEVTPEQLPQLLSNYSFENAIYQNGILRQKTGEKAIQTIEAKKLGTSLQPLIASLPAGILVQNSFIPTQSKERFCVKTVDDFLYSSKEQKLLGICGLRRTGKTVIMEQEFNKSLSKNIPSVFITIENGYDVTMSDLKNVILNYIDDGIKHFFIDEITFIKDFQLHSTGLGDVFSKLENVRIVISGTFSLSMIAASKGNLYDRITLVNTSYISYKEYNYLLNCSLEQYLANACRLNTVSDIFNRYEETHDYVSTSIVDNIEYSLRNAEYSPQYRDLHKYFSNKDITTILFRLLDYICIRWTEVDLNSNFVSNILGSAKQQCEQKGLIFDKEKLEDILSEFIYYFGVQRRNVLDDISKEEVNVLKRYLSGLGVRASESLLDSSIEPMIIQYGLVYSYTEQLIETITNVIQKEKGIDINTLEVLKSHLKSDTCGHLLENTILYETTLAFRGSGNKVAQLTLPAGGEIDMVISNGSTCDIYEIKWNKNKVTNQYKWLLDAEVNSECERLFGHIKSRTVLYMGENGIIRSNNKEISYLNAEQYLKKLSTKRIN